MKSNSSQQISKKESERRSGLETNLQVRSFDSSLPPEEYMALSRLPVHIVLDNLRSAFNVGSIIRTADCVRAEKIHFCGYTAHPPHQKLEKTSLGTMPYVPWKNHESILEAIHEIKEKGLPIIALETTNQSHCIWEYNFPLPCALLFGNEALGISPHALNEADDLVEIPTMGFKNSINVAVTFGIVAYEIQRQQWKTLQSDWIQNRKLLKEETNEKSHLFSHRHY